MVMVMVMVMAVVMVARVKNSHAVGRLAVRRRGRRTTGAGHLLNLLFGQFAHSSTLSFASARSQLKLIA